MTRYILDLNDSGVRISNDSGIAASSPGYAVIFEDTLHIGLAAEQNARLHPRHTYNRFWLNLSQNHPLALPTTRFRHHADIAYEHLRTLHEQAGKPEEMILAVPGNYSREQLALILGIAQALPFKATGLVDSAVASAAAIASPGRYQHIDILLHQTILTIIESGSRVDRHTVDTIENGGITAVYDATASLIADLFILNCRFDPMHHAETEQIVYNQIPNCLKQLSVHPEVQVEIQHRGVRNQIRLARTTLIERLDSFYQGVLQRLDPSCSILLSERTALLPGFASLIPEAVSLDAGTLYNGCQEHLSSITSSGPQLTFVTNLPSPMNPVISTKTPLSNKQTDTQTRQARQATHLLSSHCIYPLQQVPVYLSTRGSVHSTRQDTTACSLVVSSFHAVITPTSDIRMYVNGDYLTGARTVYAGDKLSFAGYDTVYTLVRLVNSDVA